MTTTMKGEIRYFLKMACNDYLDRYMRQKNFIRRKNSLIYTRNIRASTQKIDLFIEIHPKDSQNSAAAVYPKMEVLVPAVDKILSQMIGNNIALLEGGTAGRSMQPIGFTSQKAHTGRWFVYQPDSVSGLVNEIKSFIEHWTMPFLDDYAEPADILAADQRNDGRLPRDRAQIMRVVAAAIVCNREDYAQAVMEKWLGAPGARRRYEQVYEYIRRAKQYRAS